MYFGDQSLPMRQFKKNVQKLNNICWSIPNASISGSRSINAELKKNIPLANIFHLRVR